METIQFNFECIRAGKVFGHGGSETHGLFYSLLDNTCPEYSQILHQAVVNPYSLGPLRGAGKRSSGNFYLQTGIEYSLSISALTGDMGRALAEIQDVCRPAHQFRLGTADCRWLGAKRIAVSSYEDLLQSHACHKFTVRFVSPTCFRSQGLSLLFPAPELVFGSLAERWNAFAPISIEVEKNQLPFVSKYSLKTSLVQFSKYRMTGFIGSVEYGFPKVGSASGRKAVVALARFAGFAGVGYKTGMGMGESRFDS